MLFVGRLEFLNANIKNISVTHLIMTGVDPNVCLPLREPVNRSTALEQITKSIRKIPLRVVHFI